MRLSTAHKHERGFTLAESVIIVVIIGFLATIATQSFLALLNNKKVDNALMRVELALKQAQREAIKTSKSCVVSIPNGVNIQLTSNCLDSSDWSIQDIDINRPPSLETLTFDFKGRINDPSDGGIIVLSLPDGSGSPKCLEISTGIGLMRTGSYDGSNCNTQ
jgi:type II secretory pathway pseudopilin PulG